MSCYTEALYKICGKKNRSASVLCRIVWWMYIDCRTAVATRAPRKAKTRVVSDDDDDFINDHNEEEDEEDFGDDELVTKKKRRGTRRSGRSTRRSRRARDSDSDEPKPKRRPRAASLKKPKYSKCFVLLFYPTILITRVITRGAQSAWSCYSLPFSLCCE